MHTMPSSLLKKRSQGQPSGMTRRGGVRGKSDDWSTSSSQLKKHQLEKFEGGSSVWTNPALEPDRWGQPAPGGGGGE